MDVFLHPKEWAGDIDLDNVTVYDYLDVFYVSVQWAPLRYPVVSKGHRSQCTNATKGLGQYHGCGFPPEVVWTCLKDHMWTFLQIHGEEK